MNGQDDIQQVNDNTAITDNDLDKLEELFKQAEGMCMPDILADIREFVYPRIRDFGICSQERLEIKAKLDQVLSEFHKLELTYSSDIRKMQKQGSARMAVLEQQLCDSRVQSSEQLAKANELQQNTESRLSRQEQLLQAANEAIEQLKSKCSQKDVEIQQMANQYEHSQKQNAALEAYLEQRAAEIAGVRAESADFKDQLVKCQIELKARCEAFNQQARQLRNYQCIMEQRRPTDDDVSAKQRQIRHEVETLQIGVFLDNEEWAHIQHIQQEYAAYQQKYEMLLQRVSQLEALLAQDQAVSQKLSVSGQHSTSSALDHQQLKDGKKLRSSTSAAAELHNKKH